MSIILHLKKYRHAIRYSLADELFVKADKTGKRRKLMSLRCESGRVKLKSPAVSIFHNGFIISEYLTKQVLIVVSSRDPACELLKKFLPYLRLQYANGHNLAFVS